MHMQSRRKSKFFRLASDFLFDSDDFASFGNFADEFDARVEKFP